MALQDLPIGVQEFEKLRNNNCLYVDKTQHLHRLIKEGSIYFLSRPRRFGKSLMISTLEAIFQGKKALFENTFIGNSDYDWPIHPVIHLDMTDISRSSNDKFDSALIHALKKTAKTYQVQLPADHGAGTALSDLIESLKEKYNDVVVLIDEYDKPILDNINNPDLMNEIRDTLREFYGRLKSQDANLRFVMLTGVTKFSKVSIFSGLNSPDDITMVSSYAAILGYTQQELELSFAEWIDERVKTSGLEKTALLEKIKAWYNGYLFAREGDRVYNPYSTLLLMKHGSFDAYWFSSGTPKFLLDLIEKNKYTPQKLENIKVSKLDLENHDVDQLSLVAVLYQAGYLTVADYHQELNIYFLGYPNLEVKLSFTSALLSQLSEISQADQTTIATDMIFAIQDNDYKQFFELLKTFLSGMSYQLHEASEKYYQSIFFLIFRLLGFRMNVEVTTNNGRIDAILKLNDKVLIFEFKLDQSAEIALAQIHDKQYYAPYQNQDKEIILFGVNFSMSERNIVEYKQAVLN